MDNSNIEEPIENLDDQPITDIPSAPIDYSNEFNTSSGINSSYVTKLNFSKKEDIGLLPPGRNDNYRKLSLIKKILFTIVILASLAAIGYGLYYYLSLANSKAKNRVKTNELIVDIGASLSTNPEDYATFKGISSANCYVDLKQVDSKSVGKYTYSIVCGNEKYPGSIIIKDGVLPVVTTKPITKIKNSDLLAEDFIITCEDDSKCTHKFKDDSKVKEYLSSAGEYEILIITSDESNNQVESKEKLTVIEADIAYYLTCTNMGFSEDNSYMKTQEDKLAFDNNNSFLGIANRKIVFNYFESNKYKNEKSGNSTGFKDYQGTVTYNDDKYEVTFNFVLDNETLNSEYANEFPTDYLNIWAFYVTKNFTCNK